MRSRRQDDRTWPQFDSLLAGDLVAADHLRGNTREAEIPRQVVDKRVLIVEQQNQKSAPLGADEVE